MVTMDNKLLISVSDVAEMLSVSRPVIYRLLDDPDFQKCSIRIGKRRLISLQALEEWIKKNRGGGIIE